MAGLGTAAAGQVAAGFGDPATGSAPPAAERMSRYIDPATGEYEVDSSTGNFRRWTPVQQRVFLALKTVFGSSSVQRRWGVRLPRKVTASFNAEVEQAARDALARMTDVEKVIRILRVEVDRVGSRSRCAVYFRDLTDPARAERFITVGV